MKKEKEEKITPKFIGKVWKRKGGKYSQKILTVPSLCGINEGDYVEVTKLE